MRRILPALLAAIGCAACTVPIFDPSASLAARTLDQIPVYVHTEYLGNLPEEFDFRTDVYTFLPERSGSTLTEDRGFVIRTREGSQNQICYEWYDDGVKWIAGGWEYSSDDPMLPRWTVSLKYGPTLGAVSLNSSGGEAFLLAANTVTHYFDVTSTDLAGPIQSQLFLASTPQVVGASVNATNAAADRIRVLVREGSLFSEAWASVDSSGIAAYGEAFVGFKEYDLSSFLGTPGHLRYFHDGWNSRSFAQSYDSGGWTTWVWWNTTGGYAELPSVTHRIDAVISHAVGNTLLFSIEDQVGRVYEYDGSTATLVAEFPLGSLRFIGEAWIDGIWRMLFSRCLLDTSNDTISFEIRAINTDQLVDTFGL